MLARLSVVTKLNLLFSLFLALLVACAWLGLQALQSAEAQAVLGAGIVLVAVLALVLRVSIRSGIQRSMRAASIFIGKVAEGDLTARVGVSAYGETQKVLVGLEQMSTDLRTLVGEVARGARSVADTSAQIAQGNLDLSQRTEEQASTLEETASSMEQLTSTVAHNADHARQASKLAGEASDSARRGEEAVADVVATMDGILDSSRKMADIIGVIDGIAFQTNILALNAAVEAARAGEQGRGFAVVAAEVRSLAHRAAASAKEIKTLIADSQQKVQAGSNSVDAAGHTMVEVNLSVQKVSQLIAEIAAASQEQSAGIGQVNTAVAQMERVVQQNASLVEEASAATESMKEQAGSLLKLVSRFKVGESTAAPAYTPLHPAGRPAPRAPAAPTPAPIQVRSGTTALPPAAGAIPVQPRPARPGSGDWEEF